MENSYYFVCFKNTICLYSSLFDKLDNQSKFIFYENVLMKSAIKINNDFVVFKSNKIASKGMSQLLLYNYRLKRDNSDLIQTQEEYSFIFSPLGQALIIHKLNDIIEDIGNKILLFACKKYIKTQRNGILLLYNLQNIFERKKVDSYFYNTDNFESYCICPLFINESIYILESSVKIKETDFFLVGGFDKKRKQGMIKLYKIIYDENISIEYIHDIKLFDKHFKGFKGPISCITQSKKYWNLLITCWDGNVYFADKPDIRFYLE